MNLKIIIVFMLLFKSWNCFTQANPVSIEWKSLTSKGNFIYWQWENQFKLNVKGASKNDLTVSVTHGTLTKINDSIFSLVVTLDSSKVGFIFTKKLKGKSVLVDSKRRTVREVKAIGLALDAKLIEGEIKLPKSELTIGKKFYIILENDHFKNKFACSAYEAFCANGGGNFTGVGSVIGEGFKKNIIETSGPGRPIYIDGYYRSEHGSRVSANGKIIVK